MQASDRVLAWRYGRALFEAAAANKEEAKVQAELQAVQPDIRELLPVLRNPRVSNSEKREKLETALSERASSLVRRFLGLLIDKKRFEILPMVIAARARVTT